MVCSSNRSFERCRLARGSVPTSRLYPAAPADGLGFNGSLQPLRELSAGGALAIGRCCPFLANPKVLKWGWVKTYYYHICGNQHPLASYFRYRLGPRVLTHSQVLKSPWNPHLSYDLYLDVPYMDPVVPSKYDWGMVWLWLWCTFSDSVYGSIGVICCM